MHATFSISILMIFEISGSPAENRHPMVAGAALTRGRKAVVGVD
jgi:hypothetical protein